MKRSIEQRLVKWKASKSRKPLILNGARQVGKTYILREFGEKYHKNVVYANLGLCLKIVEKERKYDIINSSKKMR